MSDTRRLKIGLDIDGCIADFIGAFRNEAAMVLDRQMLGEPVDWDFSNWMNTKEQSRIWNRIQNTENWFEKYPRPMPGVIANLRHLTRRHEIYFISNRIETKGDPVQVQTQFWLEALQVDFPTVIITKHKGAIAAALGLNIFLDDKPENLIDINNHLGTVKLFLQDSSHNQDATIGIRVHNFEEFIDELAKGL